MRVYKRFCVLRNKVFDFIYLNISQKVGQFFDRFYGVFVFELLHNIYAVLMILWPMIVSCVIGKWCVLLFCPSIFFLYGVFLSYMCWKSEKEYSNMPKIEWKEIP